MNLKDLLNGSSRHSRLSEMRCQLINGSCESVNGRAPSTLYISKGSRRAIRNPVTKGSWKTWKWYGGSLSETRYVARLCRPSKSASIISRYGVFMHPA